MTRNERLQALCRDYLTRLRTMASRHGLTPWIDDTIRANIRNECAATQEEVEALSRVVDDERLSRVEVPKVLGKSYRQCNDDEDFDNIKHLRHVGIYSKVDTMLYNTKCEENGKKTCK